MLNFNKKKYVSNDNLAKFSGMMQKAMSDKLNVIESKLKQMIDSRFQALTNKEQGDSEVIDAREGKLTLLENLRTFVKNDKYIIDSANTNAKIRSIESDVNDNTTWRFQNMKPVQNAINFVSMFTVQHLFEENGYIKMPEVLGRLTLQWGVIVNERLPGDITSSIIAFPIEFSGYPINIQLTVDASHGADNRIFTTSNITPSDFRINTQPGEYVKHHFTTVRWFAIGR